MEKEVVENPLKAGIQLILACSAAYGIYALTFLVEIFDFLYLIHGDSSPQSAKDLIYVMYFIVDLVICVSLAVAFLLLFSLPRNYIRIVWVSLLLSLLRGILVYYLYIYYDPSSEVLWVPYIYKYAFELTPTFRKIFLPTQILLGFITAGYWWKNRGKFLGKK